MLFLYSVKSAVNKQSHSYRFDSTGHRVNNCRGLTTDNLHFHAGVFSTPLFFVSAIRDCVPNHKILGTSAQLLHSNINGISFFYSEEQKWSPYLVILSGDIHINRHVHFLHIVASELDQY